MPDDKHDIHGALVDERVLTAVEQLLGPQARVWFGIAAHRLLPNTTNMQRVAYAAQYVEAAGVYAETGKQVTHIAARTLRARWASGN